MHMEHDGQTHSETHTHEHTHSHTHEHSHDGVIHSHPHDHAHTHTHEHPHSHDNLHEEQSLHVHTHEPAEQLTALINYMVNHNVAHTKELADVAHQLSHIGKEEAWEKVMSAVKDYEAGNQKLAEVLSELSK